MRILDRRYEMMPRRELEQFQLERLQALLVRLKRNVRRYREQLAQARVDTLAELTRLPVTTPEDLAQSFPYGMFALPLREVIRLHSTLGPEGKPLVIGHTRNDLAQWGRLVARQLVASGVTANDVVQLCLGEGVYGSASGYVQGAEVIEASVIAEEPSHIDYQLAMLQNYRPTVLVTTPTNASELVRMMDARRVDPQSLHLRTVLLSRPVAAEVREQLRAGLFAPVQCNFGVGEILDPGFCVECEAGHFHVHEDQFLVEVRDGELLVTTLCREAAPLLRYATRVTCELMHDKCSCGRTGVLIKPGPRRDGRLRVNEMPLYEGQIAGVLAQTEAAGLPFGLEVRERHVVVRIQMSERLLTDMIWPMEHLQRRIQSEFLARLGIEAEVRLVSGRQPRPDCSENSGAGRS
jgi:phenylacetate-CoA ligase